jgi:serine/threonine-protein kinase
LAIWTRTAEDEERLRHVPPGWRVTDLGLLGQGGMSRVYRVRDESLGRESALKVLRPELVREDGAVLRFVEEAKITAQLDHPNIPPVYALSDEKKKSTCFTMKVLEGLSLQQMLLGPRPDPQGFMFKVLEVLVRVCDATAFAHARGILHLDLKPQNVMVAEHGAIYLVDWGLARRKAELPKAPNPDEDGVVGTPAYMAPEQAHGAAHTFDERTDVFLLGGMIYRLLTGRPPYVAPTADETLKLAAKGVIFPPEAVAPKGSPLPRRLIAIAMKALSIDPRQRYQTAAELRQELEDFIRGIAHFPERVYQPGEKIVREGEEGDCAYIILDGHCQADRVVAGKKQMLRLMGPGEMFGEAAVLTGSPRLATVTALMETTVAVVDRQFLQEEMERTSLIALAIRAVASSFLDLNGQTAALLQEQVQMKAVDGALRELALAGRDIPGGGRWVPWRALLTRLCETTQLTPETITERLGRQAGIEISTQTDRLVLKPR